MSNGRCWLFDNIVCSVSENSRKYHTCRALVCSRLEAKHKRTPEQSMILELAKIGSELDLLNRILSKSLIKKEKKRWWKKEKTNG